MSFCAVINSLKFNGGPEKVKYNVWPGRALRDADNMHIKLLLHSYMN